MNHLFTKLEQLAQLVSASLVLILAINLVRAIAEPAPVAEPAAQTYVPAALPAHVEEVALRPAEMQSGEMSTQPLLVTATPGQALVFARPQSLVQVQVETGDHLCTSSMTASNADGMVTVPVAATRNCARPRVVVLH